MSLLPPAHPITLTAADPSLLPQTQALGARYGLDVCAPAETGLQLVVTAARAELRSLGAHAPGPVTVDFVSGRSGYRRRHGQDRKQPLARAIGIKGTARPTVLDVTAGLGRDALVLASLECEVTLVERSPVVAVLLEDGLQRAHAHAETAGTAARMHLVCADAVAYMTGLDGAVRPQVVYMDPMYPHRRKSALVKKEMRVLRDVVGDDADAPALLAQALSCATARVVVKRPDTAEPLAGPKPSFSIAGESTRYDIYLIAG